jgi:hypothetical protein
MGRDDAVEFCDRSLAFVDNVDAVVREGVAAGETGLRALFERVNQRVGPFPEYTTEIAASVRSHLAALS